MEKKRWVAVLCIVLILLTGFSRNFLGVHTPQDVIVGITEAIVVIVLAGLLMKWVDGNEKRADILSAAGILFVIGALFYITRKPSPWTIPQKESFS
jgi:membrane-associated phospholipid phosphatase